VNAGPARIAADIPEAGGTPMRQYERARHLVLKYGWNSTSFQIVNPGIERWFSDDGEGVVGFVRAGGYRVVVGAPVCDGRRLPETVASFERDARADGEKVCYFGAESRLESLTAGDPQHDKFLLGSQPSWSPAKWAEIVHGHRSFRAQLNRARNKGVVVNEWTTEKATEHPDLKACLTRWLDSKGLPPLHFMVESDTLSRLENRRVFVAERGDQVAGFLILSPVAHRKGWLFEQFPHTPDAPNGTVELMIDMAMRTIADEGCSYATLGLSPLSKRANGESPTTPLWLRFILGWLRKHGQRFYNFDGLDAFKAKLRPERWEPVYAVCNEPRVSFRTVYAIAGAFSGNAPAALVFGGLVRAVRTEVSTLLGK
jgi:phosphatidylglycerol lysyltransferase